MAKSFRTSHAGDFFEEWNAGVNICLYARQTGRERFPKNGCLGKSFWRREAPSEAKVPQSEILIIFPKIY